MRLFPALLATAVLAGTVVPAAAQVAGGRYRDFGDPGGFHGIVPPGQNGIANSAEALQFQADGSRPANYDDQLGLYAGIIREGVTPGFTAADLDEHFKDGSFGVPADDVGRTYSPGGRDDVVVVRDLSAGVPHIYGETREGAMFANGYAAAEDRLFLMDVLRNLGRAKLSVFLGASPGNLAMDRGQLRDAPYVEADLTAQINALRDSSDPDEQRVFTDGSAYTAGVNQFITEALADPTLLPVEYLALQQLPAQFVPGDIVAIASLVGGIFGKGGGREVGNYCGIEALTTELGDATAARQVFDDLKFADDPDAPVTAKAGNFPYLSDLGPVDRASVPDLDCDSLQAIQAPAPSPTDLVIEDLVPLPPLPVGGLAQRQDVDGERTGTIDFPWGSVPVKLGMGMSNAILINGDRTDTGAPIAVFGPQTGYFAPQLLVEMDIHAPGIDARGVAFAGTDIYVQLGRGRDYAFSATSAGGDNVDEWILELCETDGSAPTTDSMGYRVGTECREIDAFTETYVAKPGAAGTPQSPEDILVVKHFERTDEYGPLTARGTLVDGTPIAVAQLRSTYRSELSSARGFAQVNDPTFMTDGVASFRKAMGGGIDFTFNWFYIDSEDIAYQHSCLCPIRAQGTDPYLPTWGNGDWDWTGEFLSYLDQPNATNPPEGYLTSWNNKQGPGFLSSDSGFAYGPFYRNLMIERRIAAEVAEGKVDVGEAVDVMALAATTDLRGQEFVPLLERLLGDTAPAGADARVQDMWDRIRAWEDDRSHRRDHDGDGSYEHAQAIAIMDAWWSPLFDAVLLEQSGDARRNVGIGIHDAPQGHQGSAFNGNGYSQLGKVLQQALGDPLAQPFSRQYCGAGDRATCVADVWDALSTAAADLETAFGSASVDDWQRLPVDDEIRHSALGLVGVDPINWQNRPTYQQVVQVPRTAPVTPDPLPEPAPTLPTTGGGLLLAGLLALVAAAATRPRRRWAR